MSKVLSLRARLTFIILTPLILIASAVGYWQLLSAQQTAKDIFDRGLLTVALAVANDVALSDGFDWLPMSSAATKRSERLYTLQ